jgi:hypothetical protein
MRVMAMFVLPAVRRRRIGAALVSGLAGQAMLLGCGMIAWRVAGSTSGAKLFAAHLRARVDPTGTDYKLSPGTVASLADASAMT